GTRSGGSGSQSSRTACGGSPRHDRSDRRFETAPRIASLADGRGGIVMTIAATPLSTTFTYREISLQDRLREVSREVGIKPALIFGDRMVTYAELDAATDRFAAALATRGRSEERRVGNGEGSQRA